MSMNIHIVATREVTVNKTGNTDTQRTRFDAWQTPTDVSYDIVESENPVQAYIEWVESISLDREIEVYAPNDLFHEGEPIGVEIYNSGKNHIEQLNEWIARVTAVGYEVAVEVW